MSEWNGLQGLGLPCCLQLVDRRHSPPEEARRAGFGPERSYKGANFKNTLLPVSTLVQPRWTARIEQPKLSNQNCTAKVVPPKNVKAAVPTPSECPD